MVNPGYAIELARSDVTTNWLRAARARSANRKALLAASSIQLQKILGFLTRTEAPHWRLGEFYKQLNDDASLTSIVRTLLLKKLAPTNDLETWYLLRTGILRQRTYLVSFGGPQYFASQMTAKVVEEYEEDSLAFVTKNLNGIPTSACAQAIKLRLDDLNWALLDAKAEVLFWKATEQASPELLAIAVVEMTHLPHIITPVLTAIFHRLFRSVAKRL